jgi:hypothetical protein
VPYSELQKAIGNYETASKDDKVIGGRRRRHQAFGKHVNYVKGRIAKSHGLCSWAGGFYDISPSAAQHSKDVNAAGSRSTAAGISVWATRARFRARVEDQMLPNSISFFRRPGPVDSCRNYGRDKSTKR